METNCEGCAGCCLDWRPLADAALDHERRGPYRPLDDTYNLAVLTREDTRAFLEGGFGDALVPRLFAAEGDASVRVGDTSLAAVRGRPVFLLGLRTLPKPVAPFGADASWLPACSFLDPETLQCRIHDDTLYPADCAEYPGHDLALDRTTECERVERETGDDRLLDDDPPENPSLLLGPQAVGTKVFCYPESLDAEGFAPLSPAVVERARAGDLTAADRARFAAVAAASAPLTGDVDPDRFAAAHDAAIEADSWVGAAAAAWAARRGEEPDPSLGALEVDLGAPETPGWDG
jgi:hypothetical protein